MKHATPENALTLLALGIIAAFGLSLGPGITGLATANTTTAAPAAASTVSFSLGNLTANPLVWIVFSFLFVIVAAVVVLIIKIMQQHSHAHLAAAGTVPGATITPLYLPGMQGNLRRAPPQSPPIQTPQEQHEAFQGLTSMMIDPTRGKGKK